MGDTLDPELAATYQKIAAAMAEQGFPIKITSAVRTAQKQNELYKQGRTPVDGINRPSKHQSGRALDVGFTGQENWDLLGQIAKQNGLEWGGGWKTPDKVHIQMPQQGQSNVMDVQSLDNFEVVDVPSLDGFELEAGKGIPKPPAKPQGYSVGGFANNLISDAGNEIGNMVHGITAIPGMITGAASAVYNDPSGSMAQVPGMIKNAASGIGSYAKEYIDHPIDTLYNHPARALTDLSMLTGVGEALSGASGLGKTAETLGKVSRYTDIPGQALSKGVGAVAKVGSGATRRVTDITSKFGAEARNRKFVDKLVNPDAVSAADLASTGTKVKTDILNNKAQTFDALEDEYNQHLGPKGGTQTLPPVPDPVNLNPDPPNLQRGRSAEMRTMMTDVPADQAARVQGARPMGVPTTVSTDTPLAKARPQIKMNTAKVSSKAEEVIHGTEGGFNKVTGKVTAPEFGPTFRELHEARQGLGAADSPGTERLRKLQENAATRMGLTKEFNDYLDTTKKWGKAKEQFENRFVNSLLDNPDEAIAGLFEGRHQKTYKPKYTTGAEGKPLSTASVKAGAGAKTFSNQELVGQLENLVDDKTFQRLKAKVGDDLIRKSSMADGSLNPETLSAMLKKMDDTGLTEKFIPNHQDLRDIAKILSDSKKTAFFNVAHGQKGWIRDAVQVALNKAKMSEPDLQRALRQLRNQNHPVAKKILRVLERGGMATAEVSHFSQQDDDSIPEPPTKGGQLSVTGIEQ